MKNNYLAVILTATAFGLLAGVAGALFTGLYSTGNNSPLSLSRELNLSSYGYATPNLVIRDPKKVVVSQDVKVGETITSLNASFLGVFVKDKQAGAAYNLEAPFAQALAATTDGWVMAAWPKAITKAELTDIAADYIVIDGSRHLYEIDQTIANTDQTGDFLFLHLKNASGLNVRRLSPDTEIKAGESLLLAGGDSSFPLNAVSAKAASSTILSSDVYSQKIKLAYSDIRPAFVFSLAGDLVGAIDWQGQWLAGPELDAYWRSLLKTRALSRPFFGVNYLDLAAVAGNNKLPEKGAKLQNRGDKPAVLKNSPAEKAGLKAGDIITRVNGVEINADNDLAVVIAAANSGDSVSVEYSRNGASAETEVVLGALK